MSKEMEKLIVSLYPVEYDGVCYIWSKRGMLMDIHVRMRGWGWIQYLNEKIFGKVYCGQIQNDIGEFIKDAINEKIKRDLK